MIFCSSDNIIILRYCYATHAFLNAFILVFSFIAALIVGAISRHLSGPSNGRFLLLSAQVDTSTCRSNSHYSNYYQQEVSSLHVKI